jgi:hypothetical protein
MNQFSSPHKALPQLTIFPPDATKLLIQGAIEQENHRLEGS